MPSEKEILIFQANEAIEDVNFHIRMEHGDSAIISAVKNAITYIERAIEACPDNDPYKKELFDDLAKMNEYSKFYGSESSLYINLRNAVYFRKRDELDEFDIDEITDIVNEIKESDNINDKLAVAILAELLGEEYKGLATEMIQEYLYSNESNIFISREEIVSLYNKLQEI